MERSYQNIIILEIFDSTEKLRPVTFQQHQNRRKRISLEPISGHVNSMANLFNAAIDENLTKHNTTLCHCLLRLYIVNQYFVKPNPIRVALTVFVQNDGYQNS